MHLIAFIVNYLKIIDIFTANYASFWLEIAIAGSLSLVFVCRPYHSPSRPRQASGTSRIVPWRNARPSASSAAVWYVTVSPYAHSVLTLIYDLLGIVG